MWQSCHKQVCPKAWDLLLTVAEGMDISTTTAGCTDIGLGMKTFPQAVSRPSINVCVTLSGDGENVCWGMAVTPTSDSAHPEPVKPSLPHFSWNTDREPALLSQGRQCCRSLPPAMAKEGKKGHRERQRLGKDWLQLGRIINLVGGVDCPWKWGTDWALGSD